MFSETSGGYSRDDLALEQDENPVGEREDLLQLERDEEHAASLVALGDQPPVDELDRADVEAARRLGGDQHARVAVISRARITFCWLPPERARRRACGAAAAHVERGEHRRAWSAAAAGRASPARIGLVAVSWRARFSARLKSRTSPRACRSSGMCPMPACGHRARRRPHVVLPPSVIVPDAGRRSPVRASMSSSGRCPRRRRCRRSPRAHLEGRAAHLSISRSSITCRSRDLEQRGARGGRALLDASSTTSRPTISSRQLASVALLRVGSPTTSAARRTVTRSAIVEHLAQLVGDEDDRHRRRPRRFRRIANSSSISCGVRTAVGSSRMSMSRAGGRAPSGSPRAAARRRRGADQRVGVDLEARTAPRAPRTRWFGAAASRA